MTPAPKREEQRSQGQERYPAHGLWPGFARPRARIPTASGRGSRQGCSRLKAGVSDKKQSKHMSNYFELICFMKRIFKSYFRNILFRTIADGQAGAPISLGFSSPQPRHTPQPLTYAAAMGGCWPRLTPQLRHTPQLATVAALKTAAALERAWVNVVMEGEEGEYDKELGKVEEESEDGGAD